MSLSLSPLSLSRNNSPFIKNYETCLIRVRKSIRVTQAIMVPQALLKIKFDLLILPISSKERSITCGGDFAGTGTSTKSSVKKSEKIMISASKLEKAVRVTTFSNLPPPTVGRNRKKCARCLLRLIMFTDKTPRLEAINNNYCQITQKISFWPTVPRPTPTHLSELIFLQLPLLPYQTDYYIS